MKDKRRLFWWLIPVVLAVLVVLVAAAWSWRSVNPAQTQATQATPVTPVVTATASPQAESTGLDVTATGTLRTGQTVSLAWQAAGKVAQVMVKKGDQVQKGQILAQIDLTSAISWATTQTDLLSAQQSLADLQNVAVAQAVAKLALINAQNAVSDAQTALDALNTPPSKTAIDAWKALYLEDGEKVTTAQATYDAWIAYASLPVCVTTTGPGGGKPGGGPGGGGGPADAVCNALSDADLAIQQANAKSALSSAIQTHASDLVHMTYLENYVPDATLLSKAETTLALDQQQLLVARAAYDAVKDGPSPAKIAVAQASIASLQAALDKQYLKAPFTGTVTDLTVKAGDVVSTGSNALRIDNLSALFIDLQVSEIDINSIKVGQTVELMFDAFPDKQYKGTVTVVGLIGNVSGGVANFTVTAILNDADSSIKSGMTAGATIVVQK